MAPLEQFILLGDSITQGSYDQQRGFGFGAELQHAYIRVFDVINRGYSAYNTDHALTIMDSVIPTPEQAKVKFLTIWFGANDCNHEVSHGQYVQIEHFKQNLISIINDPSVKAQSPNIILFTQPPIEETALWKLMIEDNWGGVSRKAEHAKQYAQVVKDLGKELNLPVVDVWGACMAKTGWKEGERLPGQIEDGKNEVLQGLLYDGLHLSGDGYRVVFDELVKVMKAHWPEYPPYESPKKVLVKWETDQLEAAAKQEIQLAVEASN